MGIGLELNLNKYDRLVTTPPSHPDQQILQKTHSPVSRSLHIKAAKKTRMPSLSEIYGTLFDTSVNCCTLNTVYSVWPQAFALFLEVKQLFLIGCSNNSFVTQPIRSRLMPKLRWQGASLSASKVFHSFPSVFKLAAFYRNFYVDVQMSCVSDTVCSTD